MTSQPRILLNCDLGESADALASGRDAALAAHADIINIACGGHAGDDSSMRHFLALSAQLGVAAAAHPSFPDREGFGRREIALSFSDLALALQRQLGALHAAAAATGVQVAFIKPHGALYHAVGRDPAIADAFSVACGSIFPDTPLILQAGAATIADLRRAGRRVLAEAFADRVYEPNGSLRDRRLPGALIHDPAAVKVHVAALLASTLAFQTLCIHSDTPAALACMAAAREAIGSAGGLNGQNPGA